MDIKIIKKVITYQSFSSNAFAIIPQEAKHPIWGLFTHGYTSHKNDCLPWANRLAENGIPCLIFDLPGHYLGSFNEVNHFEDFKNNAHKLFLSAFDLLKEEQNSVPKHLILGGHSLGALLALKALNLDELSSIDVLGIGIGLGLNLDQRTHLFETTFYEKTINLRRQLVSPALGPNLVFPWIKEEKELLSIKNKRIHLIVGEDDVVVGKGGMDNLRDRMLLNGNKVSTSAPRKLPHHEPALAAPHLYSFLKNHFSL